MRRLGTTNVPPSVLRAYRFAVGGSNDSVLPRICDVDAVGMRPMSSELRTPWRAMRSRSAAQSNIVAWQCSAAPPRHASNCSSPRDTGEPAYDGCGSPARSASAHDSLSAA